MLPDRLGSYAPQDRLAEGSLGPVWRSLDTESGDEVVLRVIETPERKRPGAWARLIESLASLRSLDHPGLARVLGVAEEDGTKALVEEYVGGLDFAEWLADAGRVGHEVLYPIVSDLLAALDHARTYDVAHLRLNPNKVRIVEGKDGRKRARVVGFGVGRAWGPALEAAEVGADDARYLAPEQWHPLLPVGAVTDVYSVGVLMYQALAGAPPFKGDTPDEVARRHLEGPLLPLTGRVQSLPWHVVQTVERALVRHPADRLSHAGELRLLVEGGRRDAIIKSMPRPKPRRPVMTRRAGHGDTQPAAALKGMEYGLDADTAEHRLEELKTPQGGFRQSQTLKNLDATTPATEFEAVAPDFDAMVIEDTGLIDRRALMSGPGGGFEVEDTALHAPGDALGDARGDTQPEMSHAVTEAAAIPPGLLGVDLGPPIGPTDPMPADKVDPEEDTGQFEFALTESQEVPAALRSLDLEATTDEAPIPHPHRTAASEPRKVTPPPPPPSGENLANAPTEAAEIPEFLRGIGLGGDD